MSFFSKRKKTKTVISSAFSEFIRNASSGEKKRIYTDVLEKASKMQNEVIKQAKISSK